MKVAIIGAGVAGITAAHILQRAHEVTLFEKNDYLGGHTNTVSVPDREGNAHWVDTGFIVLNDQTYPTFHRLLEQLEVPTRWSEMSFSYSSEHEDFEYAGSDLNGLFAQRRNLISPTFWKMVREIRRFAEVGLADLGNGHASGLTLGEYLDERRFGPDFRRRYLLPMGSAIWSAPNRTMLQFPAETFLYFFKNHGLLTLKNRPRWQTIVGGSQSYVEAFKRKFRGAVRLGAVLRGVTRTETGAAVHTESEERLDFDRVVFATHADQAARLLGDPTREEQALLGAWKYERNDVALHTHRTLLPRRERAWASWNYRECQGSGADSPLAATYYMNRLQGLESKTPFCVSLNANGRVPKDRKLYDVVYEHPIYTLESLASQKRLPNLNGVRHTFYCGSYFGYGFHEDAVKSGVEVARGFGLEL